MPFREVTISWRQHFFKFSRWICTPLYPYPHQHQLQWNLFLNGSEGKGMQFLYVVSELMKERSCWALHVVIYNSTKPRLCCLIGVTVTCTHTGLMEIIARFAGQQHRGPWEISRCCEPVMQWGRDWLGALLSKSPLTWLPAFNRLLINQGYNNRVWKICGTFVFRMPYLLLKIHLRLSCSRLLSSCGPKEECCSMQDHFVEQMLCMPSKVSVCVQIIQYTVVDLSPQHLVWKHWCFICISC